MGVRFYCGINEKRWNHHPVAPGPDACISPVCRRAATTNSVVVPGGVEVLQDSGAFCDNWSKRLSFQAAYDRQRAHADRYGYARQITHRASYDFLIDEVWDGDGNRHKRRWTEADAERAVDETIAAADFMARQEDDVAHILSAQGVTARQYLQCVECIVPLLAPDDILGLGGWCVIGKWPRQMMPVFRFTLRLVVPYLAKHNVRRVHIWGVIYPPALGELLWMCDQHGLTVSTDSAGPSRNPAFGEWGYGDWRNNAYERAPVETRGLDRARHVALTRAWLDRLECTRFYREPTRMPTPRRAPVQLELF